jgi:flagellar biosynthesis protein FlhF
VELAINRFSDVRADKIIFTKLDEAAHVGTVLNVVRKVNKSISYVTTGQDVPDDIEVGRGRKLAQLILGMERMAGQ